MRNCIFSKVFLMDEPWQGILQCHFFPDKLELLLNFEPLELLEYLETQDKSYVLPRRSQ